MAACPQALLSLALVAFAPAWAAAQAGPPGWRYDFSPIAAEEWSYERAAHLLERAGSGGTPEQIAALAALSPEEAVRQLVRYQTVERVALPPFEHSGIFPSEGFVPPQPSDLAGIARRAVFTRRALGVRVVYRPGTPWLQPLIDQNFYLRFASAVEGTRVAEWQAQRMLLSDRPLEEKLVLFWHGHFATENDKVRDYRKLMAQWEMFRELGNGSFRELLLGICRDPAMLIYLDGIQNVRGHPNENFARELLELFSLGPGNYAEQDIREAARGVHGLGAGRKRVPQELPQARPGEEDVPRHHREAGRRRRRGHHPGQAGQRPLCFGKALRLLRRRGALGPSKR